MLRKCLVLWVGDRTTDQLNDLVSAVSDLKPAVFQLEFLTRRFANFFLAFVKLLDFLLELQFQEIHLVTMYICSFFCSFVKLLLPFLIVLRSIFVKIKGTFHDAFVDAFFFFCGHGHVVGTTHVVRLFGCDCFACRADPVR